jgi:polar amino acid transport system substrate-binding protein
MRHFKTLAVVSAALISFTMAGMAHAQDALARAKAAGTLPIATEEQFPPYDFIKEGKHAGFNVDLFEAVGKKLNLKIEWTDLPWASVLPGLQTKKYDVVAGPASITAERQKVFRFLPPISATQAVIQIRKGDTRITKPEDIAGLKVGAQRASFALAEARKLGATLPKAPQLVEYVDNTQASADLEAGRLDAVSNTYINVMDTVKTRPDVFAMVQPGFGAKTYSSYMMRKDDDSTSLFDAISAAMVALKKEGKFAELQAKWYGQAVDVPDVAPQL